MFMMKPDETMFKERATETDILTPGNSMTRAHTHVISFTATLTNKAERTAKHVSSTCSDSLCLKLKNPLHCLMCFYLTADTESALVRTLSGTTPRRRLSF